MTDVAGSDTTDNGPSASRGRVGRPAVTSRAQILAAARRIIDRDGWQSLTIRKLSAELGIGTTTVYHHVRDRDDLLVALITDHVDQLDVPDLSGDPRARIVAGAIAIHDALVAVPWTAEVLTADGVIGCLGESALRLVEAILAAAIDAGCTSDQAGELFLNVWYFTVGEIVVRTHAGGQSADSEQPRLRAERDRIDPAELPHLAAIHHALPTLAARDTFGQMVEPFVDGLLAAATTQPSLPVATWA